MSATMKTTKSTITFKPFPTARGGDVCYGAPVLADGVEIGRIVREFDYKEIGILTATYRNVVREYVWSAKYEDEVMFKTLAEARKAARNAASMAKKLVK